MIISKQQDLLKFFIKNSNYAILHEIKDNKKCFFIMPFIKEIPSEYSLKKLKEYENQYHFSKFLTPKSQNYFYNEDNNVIFIYINSVDLDDPNFKTKEKLIRNNYKNIISQRIINEIIDIPTHIEQNFNHYLKIAKSKLKFLN